MIQNRPTFRSSFGSVKHIFSKSLPENVFFYLYKITRVYIFDSSNAVLGMAFTPPPLEKVAFCTAETNFVLHSKQNKKQT
jgi:hypothetical protein